MIIWFSFRYGAYGIATAAGWRFALNSPGKEISLSNTIDSLAK
jgi:hypothetical protein